MTGMAMNERRRQTEGGGARSARALSRRRRAAGSSLTALGIAAQVGWVGWHIVTLPANAAAATLLLVEVLGIASSIAISVGLVRTPRHRSVYVDDRRETHRFAFAVADLVGRTRASDVHRDVWLAVHQRFPRRSPDAAMLGVMLDGPRRLVLVAAVVGGLLLGWAPIAVPPVAAVVSLIAGLMLVAAAHVVLTVGRVRFGDRTRWAYASIGEIVGGTDPDGHAPRRWVGTVASVVTVNIAIALRGTSDRWTHGLDPMARDERTATMLLALVVVLGALYTMATMSAPALDDSHRSRRLEERGARQSALGATVAFGLLGLFAGVLPGGVDPGDGGTVRIEQTVDGQTWTVDR